MEGYIQTALGIGVSVVLFLLGYRQTIGAKKERAKNANQSVHRAVMRRMVLENYSPTYSDISRILEGKAREFRVSINDLLSEDQMLNSLYTEVFDSDLISPSQRVEIEDRLERLFQEQERKPDSDSYIDVAELRLEKSRSKDAIFRMALAASVMGAGSSLFYRFLKEPVAIDFNWLLSGLGVLAASIVAVTAAFLFQRSKEADISISRRPTFLAEASFEVDLAKMIEKSNIPYKTQPMVGGLRPDFLLEVGPENVVVEAKSWDDVVPLTRVKSAIDYLHRLVEMQGVDRAILVTKKRPPIRGFESEAKKVQVLSQSEFMNYLKKNAA